MRASPPFAVLVLLAVRLVLAPPAVRAGSAATPDSARIRENAVVDTLPAVEVTDTFDRRIRRLTAASQGSVTASDLQLRPVERPGEILETVPGVVISQHSGEGKANQYYLRGFNLDHGTDFATFVAGIPVNLPTHAHGQGYSDLNFVIPELVSGVEYRKGTSYAEEGDFSAAGAAHIAYANHLDAPLAQVSYDADGYRRGLLAGSRTFDGSDVLYAFEVFHNDGPWAHPDDYRKINGLLRWGHTGAGSGLRVTAMGYDGRWNSTDQIPDRAIADGRLSRFGAVDTTDGGSSHRYSLSADWQRFDARSFTEATAYVVAYRLDLFSDFTYFLSDSVHGDQFEQFDERVFYGLRASRTWHGDWGGRDVRSVVGVQARRDDIGDVGLYATQFRTRLATVRADQVAQTSASPFVESTVQWTAWLRGTLGLRADSYWFDVHGGDPLNSGDAHAAILSPKLALALGPWSGTAVFVNAGTGFHSNDARGATITEDPTTHAPVQRVDPLVRATGAEVGVVTRAIGRMENSLTVWGLDLASELVFTGDAGTTEASRPSRRLGVEWAATRPLGRSARADADLAYSRARFTDDDTAGNRVPGAVEGVVSAGVAVPDWRGFSASARVRWFGPRPLIEDNTVRSRASTTINAELGRRVARWGQFVLGVYNLLDAKVSDVDYFYASRLPGEPAAGIDDVHTHPQAPRTFRIGLTASWPHAGDEVPPQTGHPRGPDEHH